jgi:hypothetical protein
MERPGIDDDMDVFIRYIAMAERRADGSLMTGYERFREDINGRQSGLMVHFVNGLIRMFPTVYDTAKVYEFRDAAFDNHVPHGKKSILHTYFRLWNEC